MQLDDDSAVAVARNLLKTSLGMFNEQNKDESLEMKLLKICSKVINELTQIQNGVLDAIFFYIVRPQRVSCLVFTSDKGDFSVNRRLSMCFATMWFHGVFLRNHKTVVFKTKCRHLLIFFIVSNPHAVRILI